MDRRRSFRLTLDGGMALIFLLLMAARYTGGVVHEWLGVLILVPVLMHVHVNKGWWKTVPRVVLIRPFRTGGESADGVFSCRCDAERHSHF